GFAPMTGAPGTAEPDSPVILVNESSGRTATVVSKPDGSFSNSIPAEVDDRLTAVLVNRNGTRTTIPVSRQVFRDGSVALFSAGGTIQVPGEHGPVAFAIEPGAISGKTKLKFQAVPLVQVLNLVSNTQPEGGRILGGVKVAAIQGSPLGASMDVTFPVDVNDMHLPPGVQPTHAFFGLAIARG